MQLMWKLRDIKLSDKADKDEAESGTARRRTSEHRRKQLRLAQRKHRDRKEAYVDGLQKEVAKLRRLYTQCRDENDTLKRFIVDQVGALPSGFETKFSPLPSPGPSEVLSSPGSTQSLDFSVQRRSASPAKPYELVRTASCPVPDDMDTVVGVNWVLQLESPCLSHIQEVAKPAGSHSHMVTSHLINACPQGSNYEAPTDWQLDQASLAKLLQLSQAFELEEELTIVQAWYLLKEHPRFATLTNESLTQLQSGVWRSVKCYGFGAVIDRDVWMNVLEQVMGPA